MSEEMKQKIQEIITNPGVDIKLMGWEEFMAEQLFNLFSQALQKRNEQILETLTVQIDKSNVLPGWERYWEEVSPEKFVERCTECENTKRILNLINSNN